jgi:hypothetical protein
MMEGKSIKVRNEEKAAFWKEHINKWKESELSQTDYCRANDLSRHRFTYWKCKSKKKINPIKFIPIVTRASTLSLHNSIEPLKVQVGDRYRIEVGEGFSEETLTRLIKTLADIR